MLPQAVSTAKISSPTLATVPKEGLTPLFLFIRLASMSETTKSYATAEVKKLDGSRVEIIGSVAIGTWEKFRKEAVKNISGSVKLDGFRHGNIPENVLISKIGEMPILEEMAELALPKAYIDILIDHKIDAIGKPTIQVTKLAAGNSLEFKATTAVVPEVTLPDYKKLAGGVKPTKPAELEVSGKDLEDAVLRVRKAHAPHEGHDHDKMTPEEHDKAIMASLPELNDEFVKKIGDFKDVDAFRSKLKEMVGEEKRDTAKEKRRLKIADAIAEATTLEVPAIMIDTEVDRIQGQFSMDIERMGVKLDDYLKHSKKTVEDVRKEWRPQAEKKARLQLILNQIAKTESIKPSSAEIETEVSHIVEHYADADRERAAVYAETVLTNEKVFAFLEGQR